MACALAQAGADVVSVTRTAQSAETRQLVEGCGRTFVDMQCDVGQPNERAGLIDRIVAQTGRVDILVNNAGIFQRHPPEDYPLAEFDELMQVHLHAAFDLSQQAAPAMLERGRGKIINIGSVLTFEGGAKHPGLCSGQTRTGWSDQVSGQFMESSRDQRQLYRTGLLRYTSGRFIER